LLAATARQGAFAFHFPRAYFAGNWAWRVLAFLDFKRFTFANLATMLDLYCNTASALCLTRPTRSTAGTPRIPVSPFTVDWARAFLALFHFTLRTITWNTTMLRLDKLAAHAGRDTGTTPCRASRPTRPLSPNSINRAEVSVTWEVTLNSLRAFETSILWLYLDVQLLFNKTTTTRQ
jgi:hypothetical protein